MKGAYFDKPLEWSLELQGESWAQGDVIQGVLTVKNGGPEPVSVEGAGVALSLATVKKVHARDPKAFKDEARVAFPTATVLAAGQSLQLPCALALPPNSAISDKLLSYFVTYGRETRGAHLQLNVVPRKIFNEVTKAMETFQRFKFKDLKSGKSCVEFKFLPPTSRDWAHVENLVLALKLEGDALHMGFTFNTKVIDKNSVTTALTKDVRNFERVLPPREFLLGKDMPNQDGILKAIESVLVEVKSKGF